MSANTIKVFGKGRGRDDKERHMFFGQRTSSAIWKMLLPRTKTIKPQDPIFVVGSEENWRPMGRQVLRKLLSRIGERAGILKVYPHRFRHTFAVNYLRNGGNVFTLMSLLGHSDLEMTLRYSRLSEIDAANGHRKASPVDNWRL